MGDGLRLHVFVRGLVQGVGFRHAVYRRALGLELTGWVRNLEDGRVEAVFVGARETLEDMLAWCHEGPGLARVDEVQFSWEEGSEAFDGFDIRF